MDQTQHETLDQLCEEERRHNVSLKDRLGNIERMLAHNARETKLLRAEQQEMQKVLGIYRDLKATARVLRILSKITRWGMTLAGWVAFAYYSVTNIRS